MKPRSSRAPRRLPLSPTRAFGVLALLGLLAVVALRPGDLAAQERGRTPVADSIFRNLEFRTVGPAVTGGRIHDVEAIPDDPATLYVATATGGLWKTTNQGTTWRPLFDDQPVSTFGDVAIAPSDPDVVWAGTGEQQNRQSTSWGNGVYRSTDGGESWAHLGLVETRHIGKVVVHPRDPDVAYVAALGNLWKPSEERGVYRTRDGGESWDRVLHVDTLTGVVDLALSPDDPDVLYASAYQRLRRTWGFNGGGPGSGVYRTTDGGESWHELTAGLPGGDRGRIGLGLCPSDPSVLYALVEHAEEPGTYRSRDGGESWRKVNDLDPRPMYYSHVTCDPVDPERVYVLATELYMSEDGGSTFRQMPTRPTYDVGVHSDHHAIWIDPSDPEHFYLAGDAGLHETFDRGETYLRRNNLPIGQFYAIGLDDRRPYRIYGGMQDNHSWMGPSATRRWIGIVNDDWWQIGFGDGMYQQPDPAGGRHVYVGSQNGGFTRVDVATGDRLEIRPRPPHEREEGAGGFGAVRGSDPAGMGSGFEGGPDPEEEYRFDWVTPSLVSRHDPSTVYLGGNRLFISRDRGDSWTRTKDLTKEIDRDTLSLMGVPGSEPMLSKHDGTASFSEITTIAESPLDPDVLWVGTDDGNVQVSRDGGTTWTEVGRNVTGEDGAAPELAATTYVSRVTSSPEGSGGVAYAAFDAHRRGDFGTYLFRTEDFGASWRAVHGGFPEGAGPVNDVIAHPATPRLLFAGTEHGLFVSPDAGLRWARLGGDGGPGTLPTTLYDDLAIQARENDLVVGTHGRSLWILDDLTPLEEWSGEAATAPAHLFTPSGAAVLFHYWKATSYRGQAAYAGENPRFGALLHYHLAEPDPDARIEIRNPDGGLVRTLEGPGSPGVIHRVAWDLRHEPPPTESEEEEEEEERRPEMAERTEGSGRVVESETILPELPHPLEPTGPFVSPGLYRVTLVANGTRASARVRVEGDPESPITDDEYHEREAFLVRLLVLQRSAFEAHRRAEALVEERADEADGDGAGGDGAGPAAELAERLRRVRDRLYGLAGNFNRSGVTQGTLRPPTTTHRERAARLKEELESARGDLEELLAGT